MYNSNTHYHRIALQKRIKNVKDEYNELRDQLCPECRAKMDELIKKLK